MTGRLPDDGMTDTTIGIDPSLTATGICTRGQTFTVRGDGDQRLIRIKDAVLQAAEGADLAVVEDLPTHAHGAGKTGMAQGVVRLTLLYLEVPYVLVTAGTLKKFATGRGNAPKPDLRMELYKRTALDVSDDNQVDAWWLHQIGLHLAGHPDRLVLPKTHLAALDKINYPVAT